MFKRPSKKTIRKARNERGPRMFTAEELRRIIDTAAQPLKAMILLAINGGLGNSDIGNLPIAAIDMKTGWLNFPRPKTGVERRFPLWPETIEAIKAWLAIRPAAKDPADGGLLFITRVGASWAKDTCDNPVSKEFAKLAKVLKLTSPGRGFYAIRHGFQTIGDGARDPVATSYIMGHADASMAGQYREGIDDERLERVVEHVHDWLFPQKKKAAAEKPAKTSRPKQPR